MMNNKFPRGIEIVTSAIIENDNGEILLTQSSKWNNKWTFPGGHIEPGEKIIDAVTREVQEEVGLDVTPQEIIAFGELINSKDFHRPAHFIYFGVYYKLVSGDVKLDQIELQNFTWLKPEDALKMDLAKSFADTITKFIEYKKLHNL